MWAILLYILHLSYSKNTSKKHMSRHSFLGETTMRELSFKIKIYMLFCSKNKQQSLTKSHSLQLIQMSYYPEVLCWFLFILSTTFCSLNTFYDNHSNCLLLKPLTTNIYITSKRVDSTWNVTDALSNVSSQWHYDILTSWEMKYIHIFSAIHIYKYQALRNLIFLNQHTHTHTLHSIGFLNCKRDRWLP